VVPVTALLPDAVPESVALSDGETVFEAEGTNVCDPETDAVAKPLFEGEAVLEGVDDPLPVLVRVPLIVIEGEPDGVIVANAVTVVDPVLVTVCVADLVAV